MPGHKVDAISSDGGNLRSLFIPTPVENNHSLTLTQAEDVGGMMGFCTCKSGGLGIPRFWMKIKPMGHGA